MPIRLLLPLLCISFISVAQSLEKVDSLKAALKKSDKHLIPTICANVGFNYVKSGQYDSGILYYHKAIDNTTTNVQLVASSLNGIGNAYSEMGTLDSAIVYYNNALKLYESINDSIYVPIINTNLSILFKKRGLYDKALEQAFNAITKLENLHQDQALASTYNTVSLVYYKIGDLPGALQFGYKALALRKKIKNFKGVGQSYNNIGEIYLTLKNYDSALVNLKAALRIKQESNDQKSIGSTLHNMAVVYLNLNDLKNAEKYFLKALSIKQENKDKIGEAITLNQLGTLKLVAKDYLKAGEYLKEAENIIRQAGALEELRENIQLQIQLNKAVKNFTRALLLAEDLITIKDSLMTAEKAESLITMQLRYNTEEKEQQIIVLQQQDDIKTAEIRNKQILIYTLIVVLILLMIIALLVYNNFRIAKKGKLSIEILLKELHHRVKNNLQLLSSVLSLQSQQLTDTNALHAVKSSESRVNAMALIHKKLYTGDENRSINIKEYIAELIQFLVHSYGYAQKEFSLQLQMEEIFIDVDKAIPLGLIINEVVSNSFKYAFAEQDNPILNVNLKLNEQKILSLSIQDNGKGFVQNTESDISGSFGLKMVRTLIKELKGKMDLQSENGTTYFLLIPIA